MTSSRHIVTEVTEQLGVMQPYCLEWQRDVCRMLAAGHDGWVRLSVRLAGGRVKAIQSSFERQDAFGDRQAVQKTD